MRYAGLVINRGLSTAPNKRLQPDCGPRAVLMNVKRRGWAAAAEAVR
jgi:hypothetical protein